jgi:hypothetical protein
MIKLSAPKNQNLAGVKTSGVWSELNFDGVLYIYAICHLTPRISDKIILNAYNLHCTNEELHNIHAQKY